MQIAIFVKLMRSGVLNLKKSNGKPFFFDFEYVIDMIRSQNKSFINFGKISSADKNKIYFLLDIYKY